MLHNGMITYQGSGGTDKKIIRRVCGADIVVFRTGFKTALCQNIIKISKKFGGLFLGVREISHATCVIEQVRKPAAERPCLSFIFIANDDDPQIVIAMMGSSLYDKVFSDRDTGGTVTNNTAGGLTAEVNQYRAIIDRAVFLGDLRGLLGKFVNLKTQHLFR